MSAFSLMDDVVIPSVNFWRQSNGTRSLTQALTHSLLRRKEVFLRIAPSNRNIFTWIFRGAFHAISDTKLKLNLLCAF